MNLLKNCSLIFKLQSLIYLDLMYTLSYVFRSLYTSGEEKRKEEENKLKDAILQLHVLASEKRRHRLMILP